MALRTCRFLGLPPCACGPKEKKKNEMTTLNRLISLRQGRFESKLNRVKSKVYIRTVLSQGIPYVSPHAARSKSCTKHRNCRTCICDTSPVPPPSLAQGGYVMVEYGVVQVSHVRWPGFPGFFFFFVSHFLSPGYLIRLGPALAALLLLLS